MADVTNFDTSEDNLAPINQNIEINQEACAKYGITIKDIPTEPVEPYSRYKPDDTVYGFVTEVTHDQKGTEIEIKDWGYCLEENRIELGFQNMHRSEIIEEVIKTYGLVPAVDFTGMPDDIISWDNSTKSSSSGGSVEGSGASTGCPEIDSVVDSACSGKSGLERAQAIDEAFKSHVYYKLYWNCHYADDICAAWQDGHLNCADGANILCAMFTRGGFNAMIYSTTDHYIVKVNVDGQDYWTDSSGAEGAHNQRKFGDVYGDDPSTATEVGTHISA